MSDQPKPTCQLAPHYAGRGLENQIQPKSRGEVNRNVLPEGSDGTIRITPKPTGEWTPEIVRQFVYQATGADLLPDVAKEIAQARNAALDALRKENKMMRDQIGEHQQQLAAERENSRPIPISGGWIAVRSENPEYPEEWDVKEGGKNGYSVIGTGFITEEQAKEIALRHSLVEKQLDAERGSAQKVCEIWTVEELDGCALLNRHDGSVPMQFTYISGIKEIAAARNAALDEAVDAAEQEILLLRQQLDAVAPKLRQNLFDACKERDDAQRELAAEREKVKELEEKLKHEQQRAFR